MIDLTDKQWKSILDVLANYIGTEEESEAVDNLENICDKIQDHLNSKGLDSTPTALYDEAAILT
jgi:ABC-type Fe2+-enterobactin transport system substrate-binding protein